MKDTVDSFAQTSASQHHHNQIPIDLDLEATDPLAKHEITLQFAAFREVPSGGRAEDRGQGGGRGGGGGVQQRGCGRAGGGLAGPAPTSLYFTYQFYTCLPTRTERMLLRPDGPKDRLYQVINFSFVVKYCRQLAAQHVVRVCSNINVLTLVILTVPFFALHQCAPESSANEDQRGYSNADHLPTS